MPKPLDALRALLDAYAQSVAMDDLWRDANEALGEVAALYVLRSAEEWHEDVGTVLWWHLPIQEAPYVGGGLGMREQDQYGDPTDCAQLQEDGWLTHWSPLPNIPELKDQKETA
jgi:hypothetical protein